MNGGLVRDISLSSEKSGLVKYYNGQIFGGGIQTLQMYGDFGRFHLIIISGNIMSSGQNSRLGYTG